MLRFVFPERVIPPLHKKITDDVGIDTVGKSTDELIEMLADTIKVDGIKP